MDTERSTSLNALMIGMILVLVAVAMLAVLAGRIGWRPTYVGAAAIILAWSLELLIFAVGAVIGAFYVVPHRGPALRGIDSLESCICPARIHRTDHRALRDWMCHRC